MDEYIEREAALDIVNGWRDQLIPTYGKNDEYVKCLETVAEHLESLHAADVRPVVKARWIHVPSDGKFRDTCVCSACKKSPPIESWVVQGFNACPYCFADMREEA